MIARPATEKEVEAVFLSHTKTTRIIHIKTTSIHSIIDKLTGLDENLHVL